jgi:hypothetical protein
MQARKAVPDRRRRRRSLLWRRFWQGKSFCWSKNFILTGIMEFGTGATPVEDFLDGDAGKVKDSVISWARVSKWLSWMKLGRFITPMPKLPAVVKLQAARGVPPPPDALKGEGIAPSLIPIWGQNLFSPGYQPRLLLLSFLSESGLCPGLGAVQVLLHPVL